MNVIETRLLLDPGSTLPTSSGKEGWISRGGNQLSKRERPTSPDKLPDLVRGAQIRGPGAELPRLF